MKLSQEQLNGKLDTFKAEFKKNVWDNRVQLDLLGFNNWTALQNAARKTLLNETDDEGQLAFLQGQIDYLGHRLEFVLNKAMKDFLDGVEFWSEPEEMPENEYNRRKAARANELETLFNEDEEK